MCFLMVCVDPSTHSLVTSKFIPPGTRVKTLSARVRMPWVSSSAWFNCCVTTGKFHNFFEPASLLVNGGSHSLYFIWILQRVNYIKLLQWFNPLPSTW
jgi:hypothetical protein